MGIFERHHPRVEPDGDETAAPPDEWVTVTLDCPQFTADLIVSRLESEGIEIHRPPLSRIGPLAGAPVWQGQRLGFRRGDADAVEVALRDAGLLGT